MSDRSPVQDFLDAYRAAFEAFDVPAIADLFSYPCQITSEAGEISVIAVPIREAFVPQVERLVSAYRAIGVRSAEVLESRVIELGPRLAQATLQWALLDREGVPIYDFNASYTLADFGRGLRITATAHNETRRLQAAIERHRIE
jgi:hypothetical protein